MEESLVDLLNPPLFQLKQAIVPRLIRTLQVNIDETILPCSFHDKLGTPSIVTERCSGRKLRNIHSHQPANSQFRRQIRNHQTSKAPLLPETWDPGDRSARVPHQRKVGRKLSPASPSHVYRVRVQNLLGLEA